MRIRVALLLGILFSTLVRGQTLPSTPSNLMATAVAFNQINLAWSDTSTNEDGFRIERSTNGVSFTQIAQVASNIVSYRNTGLFPGKTYIYRVRAFNTAGNSNFSNVSNATTTALACPTAVIQWGDGSAGQGSPPSNLTNAVAVSAGTFHSLAVKADGTVGAWGDNSYGQSSVPAGATNVVAVAAGNYHSLALKGDGTVIGWGDNAYGETTTPAGATNVVAIAAGFEFSLALKGDGTVIGWGYDADGEITLPSGLSNVVAIAAGTLHGLAIKSDGTVVAWGDNFYGQSSPPAGATNAVAIAGNNYHSLALRGDGTIVGWGNNSFGAVNPPSGLGACSAIAAGTFHSLALLTSGAVAAWGNNSAGQITPPDGMSDALAVAAGYEHNLDVASRPGPPAELAVVALSPNQVKLSWTNKSSAVTGFAIERASDQSGVPGNWTAVTNLGASANAFTNSGVDVTSWFRVRAFNACTSSPWAATRVPTVILDDTWSTGVRTNQNLPTRSAWWSSDLSGPLVSVSSMIVTVGTGSAQAMTYFTADSNSPPVELNVGDTLTIMFNFTFDGVPSSGTSQGFRLGIFNFADSTLDPKRVVADGFSSGSQGNGVQGYALLGESYVTLGNSTPIDIRKRTNLSSSSLVGTTGDYLSLQKDNLGTFLFPGFSNSTPYSLQFVLKRIGLNSMSIAMNWSNLVSEAPLRESTIDTNATNFRFDGLGFRPQNNSQAPVSNRFTEVKIELKSAPTGPVLLRAPQSQTVALGQTATFTATANGALPLRYQWLFNTNVIAGATNSTLTLTPVQLSDAGAYSIMVSNAFGTTTSSPATLTVPDSAPVILAQPQSLTANPGQTATFSLTAIGSLPLSYRWYFNTNTLLNAATNSTLTLTNVQPSDAGIYAVVISNHVGVTASSNVTLTVSSVPLAPSGLTVTAVPGNEVDLSWIDNSTVETGFEIERAPDAGGPWSPLTTVGANVTVYPDTTVTTNNTYWYRVRAVNGQGNSPYSNLATVRVSTLRDGFHSVNGDTTGGAGGPVVTVTNVTSLSNYLNQTGPYIVQVQGTINLGAANFPIGANKTLVGLGTNATLIGDLYLLSVSNVIVRNLFFTNPSNLGEGDGITMRYADHVWIDHCTFVDCADGELDITVASDYITVSWCKFNYTFDSGHNFVNLIGADDADTQDTGKLHVTFHHNWWSALCRERMPRVRYGRVHSYNNYLNCSGNNYCVRAALESQVRIEANYFEDLKTAWEVFLSSGTPGKILAVSNILVNVTSQSDPGTNIVFTPPYAYTLDAVADTPDVVTNNAGAGRPTQALAFEQWQLQYFGCTNCPQAAATADPDGDGQNNMAEYLAGTDPNDSASAFRITSVLRTNNDIRITWTMGSSKTNALQWTAGAGDGSYQTNGFANLFIVTNTVGTVTNYTDVGGATNTPARYYRVRLAP